GINPGDSSAPRACAGCGGRIADRFLLFSMERYWHTRCLKCSCCQAQLGDIGTTCFSKGGMILCRNDYIRLFGHTGACSACGQSIPASEMVMRAQGNVYHLKCFTCATCRNRLVPGDRFHYVNGTIFCEHDRPGGALMSGHLPPLQGNTVLPDQKVRNSFTYEPTLFPSSILPFSSSSCLGKALTTKNSNLEKLELDFLKQLSYQG
uniref:LIM domain transcription factor LMO4.1-like n=1 Tax=Scleropages formosus TaxID=113540 RepID=A0A8C9W3A1_SCLFO